MSVRFSIVVPVRDGAELLRPTLECLRTQTFGDWEAIVVDDGSTDATGEVAAAAAAADSRIRVVHQPASGVSAARNRGLREARHEWVHFLDGDDLLNPRFYDHVAHALAARPRADAANTTWVRLLPDGRLFDEVRAEAYTDLFDVAARFCPFAIHSCVVRRRLVVDAGGFDESLRTCEDWDLWARLARAGLRPVPVWDAVAVYRIRGGSASLDGRQLVRDGLDVIDRTHRPDPRVHQPLPALAAGRRREAFPSLCYDITVWAAGLMVGQELDPTPLIDELVGVRAPTLDADAVASALHRASWIAALGEPLWSRWSRTAKLLEPFLERVEAESGATALAGRVLLRLARLAADECRAAGPVVLGALLTQPLEVTAPIAPVAVPPGVQRVRLRAEVEGTMVGAVELPVGPDDAASGQLEADAIRAATVRQVARPVLDHVLVRVAPASSKKTPRPRRALVEALWPRAAARPRPTCPGDVVATGAGARVDLATFDGHLTTGGREVELDVRLGSWPVVRLVVPGGRPSLSAGELRATVLRRASADLVRALVEAAVLERPLMPPTELLDRLRAAPAPPAGRTALPVRRLRARPVNRAYVAWQARRPAGRRVLAVAQRLPPRPRRQLKDLHGRLRGLPGPIGSLVPSAGARGIPVLMYHRVAPEGSPATARWRVTPSRLDEQLDALLRAGFHPVPLESLRRAWYAGEALPRRPVVLTFDDGYADFAEHAWPRLAARGLHATVFVVADAVGRSNAWDDVYDEPVPLMGWDTLAHLGEQGVDIGSHSLDHPTLTALAPDAILEQAQRSRELIEHGVGRPVRSFAYPYGDSDPAVADVVAEVGYEMAVTCEPGPVTAHSHPLLLPRVEVTGATTGRALVDQLTRLRAEPRG